MESRQAIIVMTEMIERAIFETFMWICLANFFMSSSLLLKRDMMKSWNETVMGSLMIGK